MPKLIDLTGKRFGRLIVIKRADEKKYGQVTWLCKCDCGNETLVTTCSLNSQNTKSCGCYARELQRDLHKKHSSSFSPIYRIHSHMISRCYNSNVERYKNYGGRGITVCDEWQGENGFLNFYKWAVENGYSDGLSIERIDVNGNYEPSNCKWITMREQKYNTTRSILITLGSETHCLAEWCELKNLNYPKVYQRIHKLKWTYERALEYER